LRGPETKKRKIKKTISRGSQKKKKIAPFKKPAHDLRHPKNERVLWRQKNEVLEKKTPRGKINGLKVGGAAESEKIRRVPCR